MQEVQIEYIAMPVESKVFDQNTSSLIKDVSGVILVGGKSRRYGKNKALVKIDGIPLIERVIRVMSHLFQHLVLITNTPDVYSHLELPMYEDIIKGLGPIGGIYTGLSVIPDEAGFFVACDMPLLNQDLIYHIVKSQENNDVVVPRISGMMETLHALYSKGCLPTIERLIASRECQIIRIFKKLSVRYIEEDVIRGFDPELRSFININRPGELRDAEKK